MALDLRSRSETLKANPCLAHAVLTFQADIHPEYQGIYEAGDEVWLDLDADDAVTITQEQADELNREDLEFHARITDDLPMPPGIDKPVSFNIAAAIAGNIQTILRRNGTGWAMLCEKMGWGETVIIPVTAGPYLVQSNDHPPMKRAHDRLLAAGLPEDFSGAFQTSAKQAASLLPDLFRIARYNASAPYIYMTAEGARIVTVLCKYLNFHFEGYDAAETDKLLTALPQAGLHHFEDGICRESISRAGAMSGRRIDLEL